jgi:HK97 family phage portal protein
MQVMNGWSPTFSAFGNNAYASDVVRSTIHAIATNAAKLKPRHIRRTDGNIKLQHSMLEKKLSVRPNPHMNAYDFYYKVVTQLFMRSNAFILIQSDSMGITGFYPLTPSTVETWEYKDETYLKFRFSNGRTLTQPYSQIIHLRRYFNEGDMFGESNDVALLPTLELINTTNQGIINAIKSSAFLRGILKFTSMLKDADMAAARDKFVSEYLGTDNNGGVGATDGKFEFIPTPNEPKIVDAKQMALIEQKVYKFFNVNEKIVMSMYNENEWNAFYESVIEPIGLQLSLEFTSKLFSVGERNHGAEIIFEANRLQYASVTTKLAVIEKLVDRGLMNRNEGREIFNMGPVPDGEKYIVSLNYIQADKANEYQLGKTDPAPDEPDDPPEKEAENEDDIES